MREDRARRSPLAAHRGRRGRGGLRQGPKGLVGDAAQKEPDPEREPTGLARLLRGYAAAGLENVALWHERDISHSSGRARRAARRDDPRRLHGRARDRARARPGRARCAHAIKPRSHGRPVLLGGRVARARPHRPAATGGVRPGATRRARGDAESAAEGQTGAKPGASARCSARTPRSRRGSTRARSTRASIRPSPAPRARDPRARARRDGATA